MVTYGDIFLSPCVTFFCFPLPYLCTVNFKMRLAVFLCLTRGGSE